jgi:hypothetical protein
LKYRIGEKEKRISLGIYPDISPADARDRRDAACELLAAGADPGEKRKADKREAAGRATDSFAAAAREWYGKHHWTPKHASDRCAGWKNNLFEEIGATPVAELTAPALLSAIRKIEDRDARDLAHWP